MKNAQLSNVDHNMITLFGFGPAFGVADPSPFVLKIDAYLRMTGLAYEFNAKASNLQGSPKGKLPYIEDEGELIADTEFILAHLKKKYGDQLDEGLSDAQKATAYLVGKSLDENLYFCLVYSRWLRDDTWPIVKHTFFGKLPFPIRYIIPTLIRKGVSKRLVKQGLTKHDDKEIQQICLNSFAALSDMLGKHKYFLGDRLSTLDASCYAFLSAFIMVDIDNPFNTIARRFDNLRHYCERIDSAYY